MSKKILLVFFCVLLTAWKLHAVVLPYVQGVLITPTSSSPPIIKNDPSSYITSYITPGSTSLTPYDLSRKAMLTFGVNHHYETYFDEATIEITLDVDLYLGSAHTSHSGVIMEIKNQSVNTLTFGDKQILTYDGYDRIEAVITEIKVNGVAQNNLPANLFLQADVFVDRIYDFTTQTALTPAFPAGPEANDLDCDEKNDQLIISWEEIEGAEEYQLEWFHINDVDITSTSDLNINFKTNATRISTKYTFYELSLIFDQGYICYRVRGVGRSGNVLTADRLLFTNWSTPDGEMTVDDLPSNSKYYISSSKAFDIHKNWQYSSTYAEEGKKKEVISFFDGSLRNRQMVTKINSRRNENNNAIVGETIYDHQGRPAIQILPVPVKTPENSCGLPEGTVRSALRYYTDFNLNTATVPTAYSKEDFDVDNTGPACSNLLRGMSDVNGASMYYSPANTELSGSQAFIPDAQDYPFSQVEYTPDNTGRIRRQGGVGEEFQLGSDHETKYFYGHPLQDQLDRLFGSEVGDAGHYQKNMVVDPNGQVSVSYLDQEGRVIATSLAGEVPTTMMNLPSATAGTTALSSDLFVTDANGNSTANKLSINGRSKLFNQVITVSDETDLTIHYGLEIDAFRDDCLIENVCFSCVYDLEIEVKDQCGNLISPVEFSSKKKGRFTTIYPDENPEGVIVFSTDCGGYEDELSFTISHDDIKVGTYQITKKLTVSEEAIQAYLEKYLDPEINTCRNTLDELVDVEEENSDIDDCSEDFSCDECVTNLGTLLAYIEAGGTESEYNAELEACKAPCKSDSYYEIMREILKADVMPGGQYGEYSNNQGAVQPGIYQVSVFNTANLLPVSNANWKHPRYDVEASVQNFYFDEDGTTKSRIYLEDVVINGSNQITGSAPQLDGYLTIGTDAFYDATTNSYYVYPNHLLKEADFINYYGQNPYWANSLITYHPEYPILRLYKTYYVPVNPTDDYTSESYDAKLMSVNTWDDAVAAGLINSSYTTPGFPVSLRFNNPLALSTAHPWDPYGAYVDHTAMQNKVYSYMTIGSTTYSMMEMAAMMTRCQTGTVGNAPAPECTKWGDDIPGYTTIQNEQTRDAEWLVFRGMYIAAKQELQHQRAITLSINDPNYFGYNGCIGNDHFFAFDNWFLHPYPAAPWINGQYFNPDQPCYIWRKALYKSKDVRFGSAYDYVNSDPADVAYQQYLMTGKCPIAASFEQLLAQTADMGLLDDDGFSMDVLPSLSGLVMTMNNFAAPVSPVPSLTWVITPGTPADELDVTWDESGTAFGSFHLEKVAGSITYDWDDIVSFNNIVYTNHVGALYEFKIKAQVNVGGTVVSQNLIGNTTLQIGGCSFAETCELNELGEDLQLLMQVLIASNKFASTTAVNLSAAPYDDFVTTTIAYTLTPSPSTAYWTHSLAIPGFQLTDGSSVLKISINDFTPSTFSLAALNTVASISEVRAGYNNTLEIVCLDAAGNHLVTLQCDVIRNNVTPISVGECALPDPIQCQGPEFDNLHDLEKLLGSVLTTQNEPFNLVTTGLWTANLNSAMPSTTTSISGAVTANLDGDQFLTFDMPNGCDLVLTYDHSQGTGFDFDAITSVDAMTLVNPVNNYGSYYDFTLNVSYLDGGSAETAVLTGTSCFKLMKCTDCNDVVLSDPDVTPITFGSSFPSDNGPIPTLDVDPENHEILCQDLYEDYVTAYNNFVAINHTCFITPVLTYQQFLDHNFCCAVGSNNMLAFITSLKDLVASDYTTCFPSTALSEDYNDCNGFGQCEAILATYRSVVNTFNSSYWAQEHGDSLSLALPFDLATHCACLAEYTLYLLEYVTAGPNENLPELIPLLTYCSDQPIREPKSDCKNKYADYQDFMTSYNEVMSNTGGDQLGIIEYGDFMDKNLCYCMDEYLSELNMNLDGLIPEPHFTDLIKYCSGRTTSAPCLLDTATTNFETFELTYDDPCQEFYQSNIDINAQLAYAEQTQALQSDLIDRYVKHCMGALENMKMDYEELEHHFTLYYYDQAGNLVKTVPPEGVEFVDLNATGVKTAIADDRKNGTHKVTTNHGLATTYLYNSLNQLVAQRMPDQDPMQILEPVMPNGLPVGFVTTGIQMVNSNQGYATGYITLSNVPMGTRGYLFKTMNGGQNWTRINNTLAANFKEVKMVSATQGFAIGQKGLFFITNDGAASWDLVNTYSTPIDADFVAMDVQSSILYLLTKNGNLYKYPIGSGYSGSISTLAATPSNPVGYSVEYKDFILPTTIPANNSGILYVGTVTNSGQTYDAALLRNSSGSYTEEYVQVADLGVASFYNATDGAVAGADGNISLLSGAVGSYVQTLHTSDAAGTITQLIMLDANHGVARITENGVGTIRTTQNGGTTWNLLENGFLDANLSLNKRTSTTLEVLIQGSEVALPLHNSYSKTLFLNASNIVSILDQTPNLQQDLDLKVVTSYVDGTNTYYFGIDANRKLWRSNPISTMGATVNYTQVLSASTLPSGIVPKQIVCVKNGSGISVSILATNGKVYRTTSGVITTDTYNSLNSGADMTVATSVVAIDQMALGGSNYLIAYNSSDTRTYYALSSTTVFASFTSSLSLGSSAISTLAVHGNQVTLAGTNGLLFTSPVITSFSSSVSLSPRKNHRLPKLVGAKLMAHEIALYGENGLVLTRAISSSPDMCYVKPLGTVNQINGISGFTASSVDYYLFAGADGYLKSFNNLTWAAQPDYYTSTGVLVSDHSNNVALNDIAMSGTAAYVVGEQGRVYYTANILTDHFMPSASSLTANTLRSVSFNNAANKGVVAGDNNCMARYVANFGTIQNQIYGPAYRDVHFADAQTGTIIGDHYLVRSTTTGDASWKICLPASVSSAASNSLRKVWTIKTTGANPFMLIGGVNYFAKVTDNVVVPESSFSGTVGDIQFEASSPSAGYYTVGTGLYHVSINTSAYPYTYNPLGTAFKNAPLTINAIHVFDNDGIAIAAINGLSYYYRPSTDAITTLYVTSGSPQNTCRDIYFHDHVSGFIVGNSGSMSVITASIDPLSKEILSASGQNRTVTDPAAGSPSDYDITCVAFGSRNTAVYGGAYTSASGLTATAPAMVRYLKIESGLYSSRFFYDRLGRIVASQNSRQLGESDGYDDKYSYTLYDVLGRVYEAGEKSDNNGTAPTRFSDIFGAYVGGSFVPTVVNEDRMAQWLSENDIYSRTEVTKSYYDRTNPAIAGDAGFVSGDFDEKTQRKRIVHVTYSDTYSPNENEYDHATHYNYDIHGNVKTLYQDNRKVKDMVGMEQHRIKKLDYVYDLISGNVHRVDYQTGMIDQWHHAYEYDADNRIVNAYTTKSTPLTSALSSYPSLQNEPALNPFWEKEVEYNYYKHGPLARTVLGEQQVQGLDYAYTLQGWIKGVNSNTLDVTRDPGEDAGFANHSVAKDAYGYSLHYFEGDYTGAGGNNAFLADQSGSDLISNSQNLYNGNISRMITTLTEPDSRKIRPLGSAYHYDQLNRLRESNSFQNLDLGSNQWGSGDPASYHNYFEYDANGNITYQNRQDITGSNIDMLTYNYHTDGLGRKLSNRLYSVTEDPSVSSSTFPDDIDDMLPFDNSDAGVNLNNNYLYDAEGRLYGDQQEGLYIFWYMTGKPRFIFSTDGTNKTLSFDYDAMGHRIAKHTYSAEDGMLERSIYYILDAQGNVMSVYERKVEAEESVSYTQVEKHMYGSSRLGMHTEEVPVLASLYKTFDMSNVTHEIGNRKYELTNHLGNVLSIVSDKIISRDEDNDDVVDEFWADILQSTDYSPFGVALYNRKFEKTVETCHDDTDTVTTTIMNEDFTAGGSWTKLSLTGTGLSYGSGEMINVKTSTTAPALPVGAYKDFTVGTGGDYSVSMDLTSNTCGYPVSLSIKNSGGTVIATVNCTATGTHTLDFNLPGSGTYRVEIRRSINTICNFHVDNVIVVHHEITTTTTCENTPPWYRYAFQGQERDDELKGDWNSLNFEFRMHDPRIGRFFAIDPLAGKYPFYTPYAFSGNRVIDAIELEGLEPLTQQNINNGTFRPAFRINLPDGNNIIIYQTKHGKPYVMSRADRDLLLSSGFTGPSVGQNNTESQVMSTMRNAYITTYVDGVPFGTQLFKTVTLIGPSGIMENTAKKILEKDEFNQQLGRYGMMDTDPESPDYNNGGFYPTYKEDYAGQVSGLLDEFVESMVRENDRLTSGKGIPINTGTTRKITSVSILMNEELPSQARDNILLSMKQIFGDDVSIDITLGKNMGGELIGPVSINYEDTSPANPTIQVITPETKTE